MDCLSQTCVSASAALVEDARLEITEFSVPLVNDLNLHFNTHVRRFSVETTIATYQFS